MRPILCLDFDGVCHSYTSGWQGAATANDPAVPGLFEFLAMAMQHYEVHIFSSRSHQDGGIQAMIAWFERERRDWADKFSISPANVPLGRLHFPVQKPAAAVMLDDRALRFNGNWPSGEELERAAVPWWNKAVRVEIDTHRMARYFSSADGDRQFVEALRKNAKVVRELLASESAYEVLLRRAVAVVAALDRGKLGPGEAATVERLQRAVAACKEQL